MVTKLYRADWERFDYKSLSDSSVNTSKCRLRDSRRWKSHKNSKQVLISNSYSEAFQPFNVLKKEVLLFKSLKPKLLPPQTHVTEAKKKDVLALLKLVKGTSEEKKGYDTILKKCVRVVKEDFEKAKPKK